MAKKNSDPHHIAPGEVVGIIGSRTDSSILVFDVEADVHEKIIFDIAYGFLDIAKNFARKGFHNFLNLDALIDTDYLDLITGYKKVGDAKKNQNDYYEMINQLKEGFINNPVSADNLYSGKINLSQMKNSSLAGVNLKTIEQPDYKKEIQKIDSAFNKYRKAYFYWDNVKSQSYYSQIQMQKRLEDMQEATRAKQLYSNLIFSNKTVADLDSADSAFLNQYMTKFNFELKIVGENTNVLKSRLEAKQIARSILSQSVLKDKVQSWKTISRKMMQDLQKNETLYVTSYNFGFDRSCIERTNIKFNSNILNFDTIRNFCSQKLYENFRNNKDNLFYYLYNTLPEEVSEALYKSGQGGKGSATLDMFAKIFGDVVNKNDSLRHTALEDTKMLADALANYLTQELTFKDKENIDIYIGY